MKVTAVIAKLTKIIKQAVPSNAQVETVIKQVQLWYFTFGVFGGLHLAHHTVLLLYSIEIDVVYQKQNRNT